MAGGAIGVARQNHLRIEMTTSPKRETMPNDKPTEVRC
jgi:hypothetical protein